MVTIMIKEKEWKGLPIPQCHQGPSFWTDDRFVSGIWLLCGPGLGCLQRYGNTISTVLPSYKNVMLPLTNLVDSLYTKVITARVSSSNDLKHL
jgi:hypothetical protein